MPYANKVILMGHLTRTPELKYLDSGKAIAKFGIAVNDYQKNAHFFDVIVWGNSAEYCDKYGHKGDLAHIIGRLNYESWEDSNGNKRSKVNIVAENVSIINTKKADSDNGQVSNEEIPF